ncbi:hypothetical protein C2G38_2217280 [Gigaspora rosea]|uniref:histidine kinase n=1 Tax=Gigaspora rosea TaxID=44941 RepID=A0A397UGF2_9GLOM|nr:hypothetical protein C2G38_2217280 [Gigaspora rosea]
MSLPLTYDKDYESNFIDMVNNYDWSKTSLGPMDSWEFEFKEIVKLCLNTAFPTAIYAGPDWTLMYNQSLGKPFIEVWPELYDDLKPIFESVRETGKGIYKYEEYLEMQRDGYIEEVYFNYTLSPIFKSDGTVWGIFNAGYEITQDVLNVRRLKILDKLGSQIAGADSLEGSCHLIMSILRSNNPDIPYALIYLAESSNNSKPGFEYQTARLVATTFDEVCEKREFVRGKIKRNIPVYFPVTHEIIDLSNDIDENYEKYVETKWATSTYSFLKCKSWPIHLVIKENKHVKVLLNDDSQAVLLPIKISFGKPTLFATLICGINPRRKLDDKYLEFLQLTVSHVNSFLMHGRSVEEEKMRSKLLADLNYEKIMFFQNISHELKTPLTLMLSPLEDVINNTCPQKTQMMSHLQITRRNTCRLLKLINSLLQYSDIESDQLEVNYCETKITELTRELANNFESMAKKLGLDYIIDIPSLDDFNKVVNDKIYIDHDMYETIVFNLCSNALKHTWSGHVKIRLYLDSIDKKKMVVLEVSDTGVGIPEAALPNIFQRFYRVGSQSSRSHEGTGIGLALVKELVTRHGGNITVTSVVNQGTTFKCWFPIGCQHLLINHKYHNDNEILKSQEQKLYSKRHLYLEESSQWIQDNPIVTEDNMISQELDDYDLDIDNTDKISTEDITSPLFMDDSINIVNKEYRYQILLVDDSPDMRNYLADLLKEFDVHCACDGRDAIRILKNLNQLPDLILSDIMMPNMNGYELLDALRSNTKTQQIPVILLSAKAGEDSSIKGLDKGADDYLIKPFSTRQLITRIRTNIELSHIRRKLLYQQCKQEQIKQLLISISNKILSGSDLKVTLSNIIEEVHQLLPCERIFIISCEPPEFKNQTMIALSEDSTSKAPINGPLMEKSIVNSQKILNNDPDVDILSDVYCADTCKKVSMLSVKIKMKASSYWGWIKAHRPPNSVWLDTEIELLQQISNQLSITIDNANLLKENLEKEVQIKATEVANEVKSRILANTSHELRTPLGAIVGILSSFDDTGLADDQKDMINIMARASDVVLSTVNNILDAARMEANKIILINHVFDLLDLFEDTIELFGERAGAKQIELVMSCEVDKLPKYVMSDPERLKQVLSHLLSNLIKFTEDGEIVMKVSLQSQKVTDNSIRKAKILIEIYDTGIGIDPEFMQHVLERLSQGDKSINIRLQGAGLGLSICKKLVEINGGEIKAESQLGKGSKFWFTWNVELLPDIPEFQNASLKTLFYEQTSYVLPYALRLKRILIIHPVKSVRNAMIKYLEQVKKVNAFDTFDKGIQEVKNHKQLYNLFAYDIVFIGLYEKNEEEVIKTISELREIKTNRDNLLIILITFPNNTGKALAEKLVKKIGGRIAIIYIPITWQKLINQLSCIKDSMVINDENCNVESLPVSNHSDTIILKEVADDDQDNHEDYENLSTLFENSLNI